MASNVNAKGRRIKGRFGMLPKAVHDSPAYRGLSPRGAKLLLDLVMQFNGNNNGDLHASYSILKDYGWGSKNNLHRAARELIDAGLICVTRQGGRHNLCSLYALTWLPINDCRHKETGALKFDPGIRVGEKLGTWKQA